MEVEEKPRENVTFTRKEDNLLDDNTPVEQEKPKKAADLLEIDEQPQKV